MKKIQILVLITVFLILSNFQNNRISVSSEIKMIRVDPGLFKMGSISGDTDEKPVHEVKITKAYYIAQYELTNETAVKILNWAYANKKVFIGTVSPSDSSRWVKTKDITEKYNYNRKYGIVKLDMPGVKIDFTEDKFVVKNKCEKYPLFGVNWVGAVAICNLLSEMEGLEAVYNIADFGKAFKCDFTKNGYRLPTEAEWEFAAGGGNKSKNYLYSGSNNPDEVAWYRDNSDLMLHPVGQKKPNELGIYDMSGNAGEICFDVYSSGYYSNSAYINPSGPDNYTLVNLEEDANDPNNGMYHLRRGGYFCSFKEKIRITDRIWGIYYCPELCSIRLVRCI